MPLKLREIPEFEESLSQIDSIWEAWAVGAYGEQLRDILRGDRKTRLNFLVLELAKPLAIAMRDIPMAEDWPQQVQAAVTHLAQTEPAFFAVIQAQAIFVDDLIDAALSGSAG